MSEKKINQVIEPLQTTLGEALSNLNNTVYRYESDLSEQFIVDKINGLIRKLEAEKNYLKWRNDIKSNTEYLPMNAEILMRYFINAYSLNYATFHFKGYEEVLAKICAIISKDDVICEKWNLDPGKGLLLYGSKGVGKTSIMKTFAYILTSLSNPQYPPFSTIDALKISDEYRKNGADSLIKYSRPVNRGLIKNGGWFFDDIGVEEDANNYGNSANVIEVLMQYVYNYRDMRGRTHISTNLNGDQLTQRYGERVYSRMVEMYNLVKFPADLPDFRMK